MIFSISPSRFLSFLLLPFCLIGVTGCFDGEQQAEQDATPGSAVAVIDLDEVAKRLGRTKQMETELTGQQEKLNENLVALQQELRTQLTQKQAELGEAPTEEDQQRLMQLQQQAGNQVNQAIEEAKRKLAEARQDQVSRFREEVKPHAQAAARGIGATVILTRNDNMLFHHHANVDITDAVVARMIDRNASTAASSASDTSATAPASSGESEFGTDLPVMDLNAPSPAASPGE